MGGFFSRARARAMRLSLTARQGGATFANAGVVASGQARDRVMNAGCLRRLFNLGLARVKPADQQVGADTSAVQKRFLQDDADLAADIFPCQRVELQAIKQDRAFGIIV